MKSLRAGLIAAAFVAAITTVPAQNPTPPVDPAPAEAAVPATVQETQEVTDGDGLRFNFRGAQLETVLEYMSKAAGFVIVPEVRVEGKVDVWSYQPVSKDEAVDLLNTVLNKNGYAAIRNGKVLTITTVEDAKKRGIPVKKIATNQEPDVIPKNDELVTQIIAVRYANAMQLTKDLTPLLPEHATLTANESGNALVLTDTQTSIRRMTEIVRALDTSISSISAIRVFPLKFADAAELATVVKELFEPAANSARGNNNVRRGFNPFGGGGVVAGVVVAFLAAVLLVVLLRVARVLV